MLDKFGYTLIELLAVILIMGCFLILGAPLSQSFYQQNQLKVATNEVKNAISFGRTMALAQGRFLTLRPLDGVNWSLGFVLLIDNKHKQTRDTILRVWQWHFKNIRIQWEGLQSKNAITFSPHLKNAICNGHFLFSVKGKVEEKLIVNRLCYTHLASNPVR